MSDLSKYYAVLSGPKDVDRIWNETDLKYKYVNISRRNAKGKVLWYAGWAVSSYDPDVDLDLTLFTEVTLDEYIEMMKNP